MSPSAPAERRLPVPDAGRRLRAAGGDGLSRRPPIATAALNPATGGGDDIRHSLPAWDDLRTRLRFSLRDGRIWLDDQRMLLIHLSSLASLRREMINLLGIDRARGLLMRMGHESGTRDAAIARKVRPGASYFDILAVGPQLHALEGIVAVDPGRIEVDVERGHFYGEFIWRDSSEADCHLQSFGQSADPVCWMQLGYAMGYTSAFMGRPIIYREVQCRAMGHAVCRIVGKPAEEWPDPEREMRHLQPVAADDGAAVAAAPAAPPARMPEPEAPSQVDRLVGTSSGFTQTCALIRKVASTNATVLFLGETGVGKERFARALHQLSGRAGSAFVAVNCAAIPDTLIEAELFGVEKGAYTGALQSRPGRFERADGGTLFLDEIGTLNPMAQSKLLRVLQEREVERVGDVRSRRVDVRVIAATNVNLQQAVRAGDFREDLFFRLNVFPVRIPPLRERRDDIPMLMEYFLRRFATQHGRRVAGFAERAVSALFDYDFPGNVRELENMVERAVILAGEDDILDVGHLFPDDGGATPALLGIDRQGRCNPGTDDGGDRQDAPAGIAHLIDRALDDCTPLEEIETMLIRAAVERSGGNLSLAARSLGMTRPQLAYRFSKLDED
ncbi:MAG: AAA domain-containing protein [Telmatospirillum sp.]|nr:AAA domain-containing protein [Telmatospirillum sp.]